MKALVQKLYLILVYGLLYFPILVLITYSVNNARFSLLWVGFYGLFVFCWVVEGEFWVEFLLGFFAWLDDSVKIESLFVWGVGIGI